MSIQLALDGHSFSVSELSAKAVRVSEGRCRPEEDCSGTNAAAGKEVPQEPKKGTGTAGEMQAAGPQPEAGEAAAAVAVEILSPRTLLVPAELFDASQEDAAALLAAAGMPAQVDDTIVWSDPQAEVVAVMAAGREAVATVRERFGGKAAFTTPLLHDMPAHAPSAWMYRAGGLLYIKVYDAELQLAEVLRAPTDDDVLCIVEQLGAAFAWEGYALHLAGNGTGTLHKMLKNRFKTVVCE